MIEQIFAIPGIGRYYVTAVTARDYSVVMGLTVLLAMIVIIANMVVDILYGILDPRTREAHGDVVDAAGARRRPRAAPPRKERRYPTPPDGVQTDAGAPIRASSLWRDAWYRYIRNRAAVIAGVGIPGARRLLPDLADRLTVRSVRGGLLAGGATAPSLAHPFGAEQVGRDLFTRTALGGRVSIGIGFAATFVILTIGVTYGGHRGLPRRVSWTMG